MSSFQAFSCAGKKALVRVDFNVPLNEQFQITDDTRMRATVKTINKILQDSKAILKEGQKIEITPCKFPIEVWQDRKAVEIIIKNVLFNYLAKISNTLHLF